MKWIATTVIVGAICFYAAGKASKAVKNHNNNEYNVLIQENTQLTTALDYLKKELGE